MSLFREELFLDRVSNGRHKRHFDLGGVEARILHDDLNVALDQDSIRRVARNALAVGGTDLVQTDVMGLARTAEGRKIGDLVAILEIQRQRDLRVGIGCVDDTNGFVADRFVSRLRVEKTVGNQPCFLAVSFGHDVFLPKKVWAAPFLEKTPHTPIFHLIIAYFSVGCKYLGQNLLFFLQTFRFLTGTKKERRPSGRRIRVMNIINYSTIPFCLLCSCKNPPS